MCGCVLRVWVCFACVGVCVCIHLFICACEPHTIIYVLVYAIAAESQQAESVLDDSVHQPGSLQKISFTQKLEDTYEIGSILGEGRFAVVWSGGHKISRKEVALKMINRAKVFAREDIVENELRIMRSVNHPNIIKLIEDFESEDNITLVMELVQVGVVCVCVCVNEWVGGWVRVSVFLVQA